MASKKKVEQLTMPAATRCLPGGAVWHQYHAGDDEHDEAWELLWDDAGVAIVEDRDSRNGGEGWTARTANAFGGKWVHCESRASAMLWAERLLTWALPAGAGPTKVVGR